MNKKELAVKVAEKVGLSEGKVNQIVGVMVDAMVDAIVAGEDVALANFISVSTYVSAEKKGRNPSTGEEMIIPAKKRVRVKVSKNLKNAVA